MVVFTTVVTNSRARALYGAAGAGPLRRRGRARGGAAALHRGPPGQSHRAGARGSSPRGWRARRLASAALRSLLPACLWASLSAALCTGTSPPRCAHACRISACRTPRAMACGGETARAADAPPHAHARAMPWEFRTSANAHTQTRRHTNTRLQHVTDRFAAFPALRITDVYVARVIAGARVGVCICASVCEYVSSLV